MKKHNQKGFSLVEMLVVMAVITIISLMVLAQYRLGRRKNLLRLEAQKVVNSLRRVQNMSLSSQEYKGRVPELGGYGAHFNELGENAKSYVLFADVNGDGQYNDDGTEKIETINFPDRVSLGGLEAEQIDIIFSAPDGALSISGGRESTIVIIKDTELDLTRGAIPSTQTITIRKPGVIDY